MAEISITLYSVASEIKPEKEYGTILVFSDHMKFCDTGFLMAATLNCVVGIKGLSTQI